MASGDYYLPQQWVTTTSSSANYLWNGSYVYPNTFQVSSGSGGSGGYSMPAPRPPTALEWLDAETEAVCKLARAAG